MKKKLLILTLISVLFIPLSKAQVWRGYGKGVGIVLDHWYGTDHKSDFSNINLSYMFTSFSENTIIAPFVSFGKTKDGDTYYKLNDVKNDIYLWEFGGSVLFKTSKHFHVGARLGAMLEYNHYSSFKDKWYPNLGVEVQYNFKDNDKSLTNNSVFLNVNIHSIGIGYRYYIF